MPRHPDPTRGIVLSAMQTPRALPEIVAALPELNPRQVQNTVYNAVTRGFAANLRASEGRKCGGLFVAVQPDAPMRTRFDQLLEVWK